MSSTPLVCFIHIERSGGTTLRSILKRHWPSYLALTPFHWPHDPGNEFTAEELRWILRVFPFVPAMGGHCTRTFVGYETATDRPIKYMTFLRDPVARYRSHFNHQVHAMAQPWTLETFLANRHFANFQTVRLAGREDLDEAKRRLVEDYAFFGLVERFDESLVLMREAIGDPTMSLAYERKNTATNKGYRKPKDPAVEEAIMEQNRLDLELYGFAKELYEERRAQARCDIDEAVAELRSSSDTALTPRQRAVSTPLRAFGYKPVEAVLRRAYHPDEPSNTRLRLQNNLRTRLRDLRSR